MPLSSDNVERNAETMCPGNVPFSQAVQAFQMPPVYGHLPLTQKATFEFCQAGKGHLLLIFFLIKNLSVGKMLLKINSLYSVSKIRSLVAKII